MTTAKDREGFDFRAVRLLVAVILNAPRAVDAEISDDLYDQMEETMLERREITHQL